MLYVKTIFAAGLAASLAGCGTSAGAFNQGGHLTVVSRPAAATTAANACAIRMEQALREINAARASARRCGSRTMPPAPALRWDAELYSVAAGHSHDMAQRNYFDHQTPEGVTIAQRVSASRYKWRSVGENLAGGDSSVDSAVQGWLESPQHCENMMDPKFVDVALACSAQPGTEWGTYWTMVLGRK